MEDWRIRFLMSRTYLFSSQKIRENMWWERTKGCRTRVDTTPPLTPAIKDSYFTAFEKLHMALSGLGFVSDISRSADFHLFCFWLFTFFQDFYTKVVSILTLTVQAMRCHMTSCKSNFLDVPGFSEKDLNSISKFYLWTFFFVS